MSKPIATVECHCGRMCLIVAGLVLAMETDVCRESGYDSRWTAASLDAVARRINRRVSEATGIIFAARKVN